MAGNIQSDEELMSEINITPMVDVMLVLMIIFLVTAPMLTNNMNINLPDSEAAVSTEPQESYKIYIDGLGKIFFNEKQINLLALEAQIKQANTKTQFQIFADRHTPYEKIAKILEHLQKNDVKNIGLITEVK